MGEGIGRTDRADTDCGFVEVLWGRDPSELMTEFLEGICETLYVTSAVVEQI